MKSTKLRIILSLVGLMMITNLFSQDNHNYYTPAGRGLFYREVTDANRTILRMNEVSEPTSGVNGIVLTFNMRQDLSKVVRPLKLLSFTHTTEANSFIDVFYDAGTITLRRKIADGSPYYYDYNLYDPMFTVDQGVTQWEVRFFFTAFFFWIETRDTRKLQNNKWHAPIFWGMNTSDRYHMTPYLGSGSTGLIIFGDANPSTTFTMPDEISINEFKYQDLKDELQTHFCEDN